MAGIFFGGIFNAITFIGGSYLVKYLSGIPVDEERKRHNLATEKYNIDYNNWKEEQGKRQLWIQEEEKKDEDANYKFRTTNENFEKYAEAHPEEKENLDFHDYYSPSKDKKMSFVLDDKNVRRR